MKRIGLALMLTTLVSLAGCDKKPPPPPPPAGNQGGVEVQAPGGVDVKVDKKNVDVNTPGADVKVDK